MPLAPYACDPARSRGRRVAEPASPPRNEHQRDRDRVVHCTAFRRLAHKTQVFVAFEGDLFRTRLTHSLEVAQIGRSIARTLALNEDLVEAIALAHDLGHTPFGHAGGDALDQCMRECGGFEHNLQSLRVVDALEQRYPEFDGLNLSFETREGLLKHCTRQRAQRLQSGSAGDVARRFLDDLQPSLEAQLCNLADEIAYAAHDVDDGMRSGLLDAEALGEVPMLARHRAAALAQHPQLARGGQRRLLAETLRRMLASQVRDVIDTTRSMVAQHSPADVEAVRRLPPLVSFSVELRAQASELKRFLFAALYRHPSVTRTTDRAREVVRALFAAYVAAPTELPPEHRAAYERRGLRALADYIAGMTDRFAAREYARLHGSRAFESDR
ncbi:MAG: deoxyguanosinetriphosphate triphosphohydrolase [Aquincola sp.]|nr:deoxyguanosinetriphosphate triphosphohydrolase [Aquincola sp.]